MTIEAGRLTTHVLDTAAGRPAKGVRITLSRDGECLADITTNADGRADGPLLSGADFAPGVYELLFYVGDYFPRRAAGAPFLNDVPVRFGVAEAGLHYHVPLLISPFGYSTYRGS